MPQRHASHREGAVDAGAAVAYRPRDGTTTVLHGVVRDH
jgi:hypothetical protein